MHIVGLTISLLNEGKIDYSMRFFLDPLIGKRGYLINKRSDEYYNLADRLSSIVIPKYFMAGGGLGSSIIAKNKMLVIYLFMLPGLFYVGRAHPLVSTSKYFNVSYTIFIVAAIRSDEDCCWIF